MQTPLPEPRPGIDGTVLLLERVQDSGNLGTMLRTAAAAGVRCALLTEGCTGRGRRGCCARGWAHFALEIFERVEVGEMVSRFRGEVLATALGAESGSLFEHRDLRGRRCGCLVRKAPGFRKRRWRWLRHGHDSHAGRGRIAQRGSRGGNLPVRTGASGRCPRPCVDLAAMKTGASCARSSIAADAAARMFAMWCGGAGSAPVSPLSVPKIARAPSNRQAPESRFLQLPPFGEKVLHVLPGSTIDRAISALRADSAIVAANGGFEVGGEIPQCSTAQTTAPLRSRPPCRWWSSSIPQLR